MDRMLGQIFQITIHRTMTTVDELTCPGVPC
jgi:hypothetical protein